MLTKFFESELFSCCRKLITWLHNHRKSVLGEDWNKKKVWGIPGFSCFLWPVVEPRNPKPSLCVTTKPRITRQPKLHRQNDLLIISNILAWLTWPNDVICRHRVVILLNLLAESKFLLSSFDTHARWQPVTQSARSRWSYGKIEDSEQSIIYSTDWRLG